MLGPDTSVSNSLLYPLRWCIGKYPLWASRSSFVKWDIMLFIFVGQSSHSMKNIHFYGKSDSRNKEGNCTDHYDACSCSPGETAGLITARCLRPQQETRKQSSFLPCKGSVWSHLQELD